VIDCQVFVYSHYLHRLSSIVPPNSGLCFGCAPPGQSFLIPSSYPQVGILAVPPTPWKHMLWRRSVVYQFVWMYTNIRGCRLTIECPLQESCCCRFTFFDSLANWQVGTYGQVDGDICPFACIARANLSQCLDNVYGKLIRRNVMS
jgi:hypothetical protein